MSFWRTYLRASFRRNQYWIGLCWIIRQVYVGIVDEHRNRESHVVMDFTGYRHKIGSPHETSSSLWTTLASVLLHCRGHSGFLRLGIQLPFLDEQLDGILEMDAIIDVVVMESIILVVVDSLYRWDLSGKLDSSFL